MKRIVARRKEAIEKFGVPPEHVVDYLAIVGDASDNIPGITGFGPKKAESLISEYGSLESIYEHAESVTGKAGEILRASREVAFLSKKLATIDTEVSVEWDDAGSKFATEPLLTEKAIELFKRLNFKSLLPAHEVKISRFEDLGIKATNIILQSEIPKLIQLMQSAKTITLATYGARDRLSGLVFRTNMSGEYFHLRSEITVLTDFLEALLNLSEKTEIIGYDLKIDVRRMLAYQNNSASIAVSENLSLF